MSGRIVGRVFERIVGNPVEKAVLTCLGEHANPDGEMSFPSVRRISLETEFSESSVRAALSKLRDRRLMIQTHGPRQHRPATYRVNLDALSDLQLVEVYRPGAAPDLQRVASDLQEPSSRPPGAGPEPSLSNEPPINQGDGHQKAQTSSGNGTPPGDDWPRVLDHLRIEFPRHLFESWINGVRLSSCTPGRVVVVVGNEYARDWWKTNVLPVLPKLFDAAGVAEREVLVLLPGEAVPARVPQMAEAD